MDNIGAKILLSQLENFHIDQLLAQKKIYSRAKSFQWILVVIVVPLPIFLSGIMQVFPDLVNEKNWVYALYLIAASLFEKVIENNIERLKKLAASVQEMFDVDVLRIGKNETLNTILVDREVIRKYSARARKTRKRLKSVENWYSINIGNLKTNVATLLCQRTNIYYDFSVRRRYNMLMRIFAIATFSIMLVISLKNGINLQSFIVEVLIPSIPVFMFAYSEINNNAESVDNLIYLKDLIEKNLTAISVDDTIDTSLIRSIQDRIYLNRILSPLIPDIIYHILRPRLEDEMNYSVAQKIKQLSI